MPDSRELLPFPTPALVQSECDAFDSDPWVALVEKSMKELRACFPKNRQLSHVLLKVITLDNLYSTRVKTIHQEFLAKRIASIGIDRLIDRGSPDAVDRISKCDGLPNHYSFASKYCCWHSPTVYPIYDGNVDECLWTYRNQGQITLDNFRRKDLRTYSKFVAIVESFRDGNGLRRFTLREIDKFLWRVGDRLLNAKKKNVNSGRIQTG